MRLASAVAGPIVKKLLRFSEGPGAGLVDRPVRVSAYVSFKEKRTLTTADLDKIAEELVAAGLRAPGERALPPGEEAGVAAALAATLYGLGELELTDVEAVRLGHRELARRLRDRAPATGLGEQAGYFHDRLLDATCLHVLHFFTQRSSFVAAALVEQSRRQGELVAKVDELVARIPRQDARDAAFEHRYLEYLVRKHATLTIFGIDLVRTPGKWPLDAAYMSLEATGTTHWVVAPAPRPMPGSFDDDLDEFDDFTIDYTPPAWYTQSAVPLGPRPADQALADRERVLLRGEAGSGKTTLVQWLAVCAARPVPTDGMAYVHGLIPFVLPLRALTRHDVRLPPPRQFLGAVGVPLAGEQPSGWEDRVLSQGRALVLVDGIDEIKEEARERTQEWLADLIGTYPGNRWLVTSRPSAVPEEWLERESFTELTLSPMGPADVAAFVGRWHTAARTGEPEEDAELAGYEDQLLAAVRAGGDLGRLATNPLMCGLICALHRDRRGFLPHSRKDLYAAALSMLLTRRDRERRLDVPEISEETLLQLLQRLALWMIRNGASEMGVSRAEALIRDALPALPEASRVLGDAPQVFRYLLLRTGLLRRPAPGRVDFVHRTFQDFLGARAIVDEGSFGELTGHAGDDQWEDVIRLAVAHARPRERTEIFRGLLRQGSARAALLAHVSLPYATELDPEVRDEVRRTTRTLIPPRSGQAADALGSVGPLLIPLLPDPEQLTDEDGALIVRAAAETGCDEALDYLAGCARHGSPETLLELFFFWDRFDERRYADEVIARIGDTGAREIPVAGPRKLELLGEISPRAHVQLLDAIPPERLADYARRVRLCSVSLLANPLVRDLAFLADQPELTGIRIANCAGLESLAALAGSPVVHADFDLGMRNDTDLVAVLRELPRLRSLRLRRMALGGWSLRRLATGCALERLILVPAAGGTDLLDGLEAQVRLAHLGLGERVSPKAGHWRVLAGLPVLATLTVPARGLANLPGYVYLPNVDVLRVEGRLDAHLAEHVRGQFPNLTRFSCDLTRDELDLARLLPGIAVSQPQD